MSIPHTVAKLIDTSSCIGCKACEVACQEWNDQEFTLGTGGSYQTLPDLAHNFWNLIKFNETEHDGQMAWNMAKYQCMHCVDPGCLRACPAPGAIVVLPNGTVDFNHENCIGCGYCITGCPFDVPRLEPEVIKGLQVHALFRSHGGWSGAGLHQGLPNPLLEFRKARRPARRSRTPIRATASRWVPAGRCLQSCRGGRYQRYLRSRSCRPARSLWTASRPTNSLVRLALEGSLKWLGNLVLVGGILGTFLHYVRYGPRRVHDDQE